MAAWAAHVGCRMGIIDSDLHVNDHPGALAPYCDHPWNVSLDAAKNTPSRYLDIPGYAPGLRLDPIQPGGHDVRSVNTVEEMRSELDVLGIDGGVLFPDNL